MSTAEIEVLEPDKLSLAELGAEASREHGATAEAARDAVDHAIRAGGYLLEAYDRVPAGQWLRWVEENFSASSNTAGIYMNLAYHKEHAAGAPSINAALRLLSTLPNRPMGPRGLSERTLTRHGQALALRQRGLKIAEIAEMMGISNGSASEYCSKNLAELRQQRNDQARRARTARQALKRAEQEAAIRKVGGGVSELYADIHKLTQKADKVIENASSKELRAGLNAALAKLHQARDEIVKAVGLA
jgi:predicted transcriptional regulator